MLRETLFFIASCPEASTFKAESFVVDLKSTPTKPTRAYLDYQDLNELAKDGLSPASWRIYMYLYNKADQRHIPTTAEIAKDLDLSDRTIQPAKKALVNAGYLFDVKSNSSSVATHICFLGKNVVKVARTKMALSELAKEKKIDKEIFSDWLKNNLEEAEQYVKNHKLLSIYSEVNQ